jgi:renalase
MSNQENNTAEVIIIGAGMAGLTAANALHNANVKVTVLDKAKNVGGRLATRRIGNGLADHGAQFFTVREDTFQQQVDQWLHTGLAFEWSQGFNSGSLTNPSTSGHPRYAIKGGMNALARHIADVLPDVRTNTPVSTVTGDDQGWILQDNEGTIYTSKVLIITSPVPQSLAMLDAGATQLDEKDFESLARITYSVCLCGLFWVEGRVTLPPPGAVQRRNGNIVWIADNQQKSISPKATLVTLQASEQYSRQMWPAPDERILSAFRTELRIFMADDAVIQKAQLKRWRYSRPLVTHPDRYLDAIMPKPLLFAGDAFGGPRVEGAYLSGLAAGQRALEYLKK